MPKTQLLNFHLRILLISQHDFRGKKKKKKLRPIVVWSNNWSLIIQPFKKIKPSADQINILIKVIFSPYIPWHSLTERIGSNKKRMLMEKSVAEINVYISIISDKVACSLCKGSLSIQG